MYVPCSYLYVLMMYLRWSLRTCIYSDARATVDLPTSFLCFIRFTGYLLSRGSNTNCLYFALRSFLVKLISIFQNVFAFTLFPGSSVLLQTPECSEYHPSAQSPEVMRSFPYQASIVRSQLPLSVSPVPLSDISFKSSLKTFLFSKTFSSVPLP